jgi:hypothetical protein
MYTNSFKYYYLPKYIVIVYEVRSLSREKNYSFMSQVKYRFEVVFKCNTSLLIYTFLALTHRIHELQ